MLQLNNLYVGYDRKNVILKNIKLNANPGEIIGLIGLNGSGKSTLLRTILGLIKPLSGDTTIDKISIRDLSLRDRSLTISMLESQTQSVFSMTVLELLEISNRNNKNSLIDSALKFSGLKGFERRNIRELSSGEVKRAYLAHALCTNSKIILLDEPFAHLDWNQQLRLAQGIKAWRDHFRTTFVLAAHELEWIIKITDRVWALGHGQVIADSIPQDVFKSQQVSDVFDFRAFIDENPIDGSQRLTLGQKKK